MFSTAAVCSARFSHLESATSGPSALLSIYSGQRSVFPSSALSREEGSPPCFAHGLHARGRPDERLHRRRRV
jgi:hypothetical protein